MKIPSRNNKKRAALYLRRSTDKQEQSIGDQRTELEKHAEEHGYKVVTEYVDDAVSGTSTNGRTGFLDMLNDAQALDCSFGTILVYDIKRFSRGDNIEASHYLYCLRESGVDVQYVKEAFTGDDTDDLIRPVKQWQARQESKDLSRVTIRGQLSRVKEGWWAGGTPPYGYDLQYIDSRGKPLMQVRFLESGEKQILDENGKLIRTLELGERVPKSDTDKARLVLSSPERVALVKRIFDMYLKQGLGYRKIAEQLNIDEIPSPRNGTWPKNTGQGWSQGTIRSIVMNPLYTGSMVWNRRASGKFHSITGGRAKERKGVHTNTLIWNDESDWEVINDSHPAIIDQKTFKEIQKLRQNRSVKRGSEPYRVGRARNSVYLLSGLLVCTHCQHHFHGRTTSSSKFLKNGERIKTRYYVCGGAESKGKKHCRRQLIGKDELETDILNRIKTRVDEFLGDGGDKLLKSCLEEELETEYERPRDQRRKLEKQLRDLDKNIDRLLDSLTPVNKELIDRKLIKLKRERNDTQWELDTLKAVPNDAVDVGKLAGEILDSLGAFEDIFSEGTLEEKKEFIRLFVEKIEMDTEGNKAKLHIKRFPAPSGLATGNSPLKVVAGAPYDQEKRLFPLVEVVEIDLRCQGKHSVPRPFSNEITVVSSRQYGRRGLLDCYR